MNPEALPIVGFPDPIESSGIWILPSFPTWSGFQNLVVWSVIPGPDPESIRYRRNVIGGFACIEIGIASGIVFSQLALTGLSALRAQFAFTAIGRLLADASISILILISKTHGRLSRCADRGFWPIYRSFPLTRRDLLYR
jgi:hypothetical protein